MEKLIRNVIEYEGLYLVDETGNVFSLREWRGVKNRILIPSKNGCGYLRVFLTKNGTTKGITVHKIVSTAFHGKRPDKLQVRHLDGNKENNHYTNLKYGTALENAEDRRGHLRTAFGVKIGSSKLSIKDVVDIIKSDLKQKQLSVKYNVSVANISMIINYKSRKNG